MGKEKEDKTFLDSAKNYFKKMFKVGLVAGGVMLAGMSQSEAAYNQPVVDNNNQIKAADVMQENVMEQATALCVQKVVLNEIATSPQYRALAMQAKAGNQESKAQYAQKAKALREKAQSIDSQIVDIMGKNPQLKIPGLSVVKGENNITKVNVKAKIKHAQNSRIGTIVLGDGNSLDNSVRMYDYKTGKVYSDPVTMQKDLEKDGVTFKTPQKTNSQMETQER